MRAFVVAVVVSGAMLGSAYADPAQPQSQAPSASEQSVAPAVAAAATPAPVAAADASAPNLDEIVCRPVAAPTGSRLGGGRECHSVRQWNDRERQSQDATREQQRMSSFHPGG